MKHLYPQGRLCWITWRPSANVHLRLGVSKNWCPSTWPGRVFSICSSTRHFSTQDTSQCWSSTANRNLTDGSEYLNVTVFHDSKGCSGREFAIKLLHLKALHLELYRISRNILTVILIGYRVKVAILTYAIIDPFILQAWVFLNLPSNEIRQFKIPPTVFSEQTTKYNVYLYFCLYGN